MRFAEFEIAEEAARLAVETAEARQGAAVMAVCEAREALQKYPSGFRQLATLAAADAEFSTAKAAAAAARDAVAVAAKAARVAWRQATA